MSSNVMSYADQEAVYTLYKSTFNEGLQGPPRDFGTAGGVPGGVDALCKHAMDAIAAGKPINWRDILGPTIQERNPLAIP